MTKRIQAAAAFVTFISFGAMAPVLAQQAPVSGFTESSAPASTSANTSRSSPASASGAAQAPGALATTPAATAQEVSDEKLQQFVASAQQVAVMSQQYSQQLQGMSDQAAQQQLMQQANEEMAQTVQANGLSVQEFNTLSEAVDRDPALQQRAQQLMR